MLNVSLHFCRQLDCLFEQRFRSRVRFHLLYHFRTRHTIERAFRLSSSSSVALCRLTRTSCFDFASARRRRTGNDALFCRFLIYFETHSSTYRRSAFIDSFDRHIVDRCFSEARNLSTPHNFVRFYLPSLLPVRRQTTNTKKNKNYTIVFDN